MRLQRHSDGKPIVLDPSLLLGAGGEARVFALPGDRSLVAKVYHEPTPARARKLAVMLADPPDDPTAAQGHVSIPWPVDLLVIPDGRRQVAGFLMPRVSGMRPLITFYNPRTRRQQAPLFNYFYLHRTARNLAAAVRAVHARGYVIGDVNESNILVTETALVTLVDTDSFQVSDPQTGSIYRCPVGKPEFTPPELQGKVFAQVTRTPEQDRFGLAVLIFQLLMEGTHPFAGIYQEGGEPPLYEERIAAGHSPYAARRRVPYRPMPFAPSFDILDPDVRRLFVRCFEDGHRNPRARPDAHAWFETLAAAEERLLTCAANERHRYGRHLKTCPWCGRAQQLGGRDPFPSRQAVSAGEHLRPTPPPKTPRPAPIITSPGPAVRVGRPTGISRPPRVRAGGAKGTSAPRRPSTRRHLRFPDASPWYNGWAWAGLAFAVLALVPGLYPWAGAAAVVVGVIGLGQATGSAANSRWLARLAVGIGTATLVVFSFAGIGSRSPAVVLPTLDLRTVLDLVEPATQPTLTPDLRLAPNIAPINVRAGPGMSYPIAAQLAAGESVWVLARNLEGSWLYVRSSGDKRGWVSADLLRLGPEVPARLPIVTPVSD